MVRHSGVDQGGRAGAEQPGRDVADDLVDQAGRAGTRRPAGGRPPAAPRGPRAGAAPRAAPSGRPGRPGRRRPRRRSRSTSARRRRGPGRQPGYAPSCPPPPAAAAGWPGCRRAGCGRSTGGRRRARCPTPAMTASTVPRSACTSIRAASEVIHMLVPSAAAERPSRVAAYFQMTYGQPRRIEVSQATLPASASLAAYPQVDPDPGGAQRGGAAGRDRVGVGHGDDHPGDPGLDERGAAGAGAAGVVAGFQSDDGGAALGPLPGLRQGDDLGVRPAGVRVEALPHDLAVVVEQHAADHRVGAGRAEPARRQLDRTPHRLIDGDAGHRAAPALSLAGPRAGGQGGCGHGAAGRRRRSPGTAQPPRGARHGTLKPAAGSDPSVPRAVSHPDCLGADEPPPTVGPGFSPGPPGGQSRPGRGLTTVGPWITAGSEFHRVPPARGGLHGQSYTPMRVRRHLGEVLHSGITRQVTPRRRSTATYEPGWLLATVFISEATAIASRGSVNRLPASERDTPMESVTRAARRMLPRRSFSSTKPRSRSVGS